METKQLTKEEIKIAVSNIMNFEKDELIDEISGGLYDGYSVLIDAVSYIGNGRWVNPKLKKRYKYKLIAPIVDDYNNLYSTDLYELNAEYAINGHYGIYTATRQMCIGIISIIKANYSIEKFMPGYRDAKYGIYKLIK